jgi:hypothetical protein
MLLLLLVVLLALQLAVLSRLLQQQGWRGVQHQRLLLLQCAVATAARAVQQEQLGLPQLGRRAAVCLALITSSNGQLQELQQQQQQRQAAAGAGSSRGSCSSLQPRSSGSRNRSSSSSSRRQSSVTRLL